jgi:hypothetical protein
MLLQLTRKLGSCFKKIIHGYSFFAPSTGNKQLQHSLSQKTGNANELLTEDLETEEGKR